MPVLIALVMVLLLPAGAGAAETTIVYLARPSPVSEYAGTAVVSAWDATTASYHLSVVHDGRLTRPRVDPSPREFDADIGPDVKGRPTVVFSRCANVLQRTGCDVHLVTLTGPRAGRVREPAGVNTRASEYAPTLWRGRLAFARSAAGRDPVVLVKDLTRSSRSVRVRGAIPTRRCEVTFLERSDCTTRGRQIDDLELFESKRYEFAQDRRQFEGFALLRNGSLRVSGDESRGCESDQSPEFARGPCPLIRTTGDRYEPIAARRVRDN